MENSTPPRPQPQPQAQPPGLVAWRKYSDLAARAAQPPWGEDGRLAAMVRNRAAQPGALVHTEIHQGRALVFVEASELYALAQARAAVYSEQQVASPAVERRGAWHEVQAALDAALGRMEAQLAPRPSDGAVLWLGTAQPRGLWSLFNPGLRSGLAGLFGAAPARGSADEQYRALVARVVWRLRACLARGAPIVVRTLRSEDGFVAEPDMPIEQPVLSLRRETLLRRSGALVDGPELDAPRVTLHRGWTVVHSAQPAGANLSAALVVVAWCPMVPGPASAEGQGPWPVPAHPALQRLEGVGWSAPGSPATAVELLGSVSAELLGTLGRAGVEGGVGFRWLVAERRAGPFVGPGLSGADLPAWELADCRLTRVRIAQARIEHVHRGPVEVVGVPTVYRGTLQPDLPEPDLLARLLDLAEEAP